MWHTTPVLVQAGCHHCMEKWQRWMSAVRFEHSVENRSPHCSTCAFLHYSSLRKIVGVAALLPLSLLQPQAQAIAGRRRVRPQPHKQQRHTRTLRVGDATHASAFANRIPSLRGKATALDAHGMMLARISGVGPNDCRRDADVTQFTFFHKQVPMYFKSLEIE